MKTIKFDEYLTNRLNNPDFKAGFEAESTKLSSAVALMEARESAGLSQRELAKLASIPQSTVARIESGNNTSFDTLAKIASALGKELKVEFV